MQVAKWGNSLAVRLPVALVQELGISEGDELQLLPVPQAPEGKPCVVVSRLPSKIERLQAMRRFRAPFPPGFLFDRDEANAR